MDQNRPRSREKRVTENKGDVFKRGDGLNLGGPVGKSDGYSDRRPSGRTSSNNRAAGGFGTPFRTSTARPKMNLLTIVLVIVVGYFVLRSLSGGGDTGELLESALMNSAETAGGFSQTESPQPPSPVNHNSVLNTDVSDLARAKRTNILGNGQDSVTIMIYMCGTDLESKGGAATADLQEMLNASISENVNIIVETGGAQQWRNSVVSAATNQRYRVTSGGLELVQDNLGKKSMVDPDTLSDFIRFCEKNYPANRNVLVFWDHGGGTLSGFGYDMNFPGKSMTLDQIGVALKDGGCTFDFIGFDACLMATLETAIALEPYADYLVASEETEPGSGWYYTNWLTEWSKNPSARTLDIGKLIIDDFVDYTQQGMTTLSIIDLAEVKGVIPEQLKTFSQSTADMIQQGDYQAVSNARSNVREFAQSAHIDQVDLIHLARGIGTQESQAFAEALAGCVKYNRTSKNMTNAYGVSIYFPYGRASNLNSVLNTYDKMGMDEGYSDCIKAFANVQVGGQIASGGSQLDSLFGTLLGGASSGSSSGGSAGTDLIGSLLGGGTSSGSSSSGGAGAEMIGSLLQSFLQDGDFSSLNGFTGGDAPNWIDSSLITDSAKYYADKRLDTSQLLFTNKDGQKVLSLEQSQWDLVQTVELNVFLDDGSGFIDLGLDNTFSFNGDGDLIAEYDNTWIAINGQVVSYYLLSVYENGDSYLIQGRVPAMLNGQLSDLILEFTDENPYGEVTGARVHYMGETSTEAKGLIEIKQGDAIDFLCDYYTYDRAFQNNYYLGNQMIVEDTLTISNVDISRHQVVAGYRLTDIYNNAFWTPDIN